MTWSTKHSYGRIPYKIEVIDPSEDEFRELFRMMAEQLGIEYATRSRSIISLRNTTRKSWPPVCAAVIHATYAHASQKLLCTYMNKPVELTPDHHGYCCGELFRCHVEPGYNPAFVRGYPCQG